MQQGCLSPKSCDDRQLQTGEMIIDMIDAKIRAWYAYDMGTSVGTCGQQWPTRYEFEQGAKFNRWFRHSLATRAIPGQDLLLGFNIFYAAVFSIEAGMRLFVQGPLGYVWQHSDWAWNWLDMFAARHTLVWHEDGFGGVRLLQVCRGAHLKICILNNNDDNNSS